MKKLIAIGKTDWSLPLIDSSTGFLYIDSRQDSNLKGKLIALEVVDEIAEQPLVEPKMDKLADEKEEEVNIENL